MDVYLVEGVISLGLKTFVEVSHALKEIRDSKLYRQEYPTFDKYCREKWGWSRQPEYIHTETYEVSDAMTLGGLAISQLERIRQDDPHLVDALKKVAKWIVKERLRL